MLNVPMTTYPPQFFDQLTQSTTEGLIALDNTGLVISANHAAAQLLGYSASELVSHAIQPIWNDFPVVWPPQSMTIEQANLVHKNGRFIPARIILSPMATQNDTPMTLLTITPNADLTHIDHALSHTQRLSSLGTLTASIAHELNTPVSIIAATCSNLKHEVEHNSLELEQLVHYVEMIEQSAWRSARILEVLRNYSYNDKPQFDVTNLNMVIEDAIILVQHQFRGQYNIKIEQQLEKDLPSIVCDHHRMTQVLLNLLLNASDAMPGKGGHLIIKTWQCVPPVQENGSKPETIFGFSVQDSGTGIADDIKDKIFNPFFTTKPHGKGTGLGLYIAKEIIDLHNGTLSFVNNEEGGAKFTVLLPRNLHATS